LLGGLEGPEKFGAALKAGPVRKSVAMDCSQIWKKRAWCGASTFLEKVSKMAYAKMKGAPHISRKVCAELIVIGGYQQILTRLFSEG